MKRWLALAVIALTFTAVAGCFKSPTTPAAFPARGNHGVPTATPDLGGGFYPTPTAIPSPGGGFYPTPTATSSPGGGFSPTPTPTPTPTPDTHAVRYEVVTTCSSVLVGTINTGDMTTENPGDVSNGWTYDCTISSGYDAYINGVGTSAGDWTLNIYVDGSLAATETRTFPATTIYLSYTIP